MKSKTNENGSATKEDASQLFKDLKKFVDIRLKQKDNVLSLLYKVNLNKTTIRRLTQEAEMIKKMAVEYGWTKITNKETAVIVGDLVTKFLSGWLK